MPASLTKIRDLLKPGLEPEALAKAKATAPKFTRYLSSELIPGQPWPHDLDGHRVDPDPKQGITIRDELARMLSNAYSDQPGRLCMVKTDYRTADDVLALLQRRNLLKNRETLP